MQNIYYLRNLQNPPVNHLCSDVRQHIISFLGCNVKAQMAAAELVQAGGAAQGPRTARGGTMRPGVALRPGWAFAPKTSECQKKFPWLSSPACVYSQDATDLISIQLVNSTWYEDFKNCVLECDHLMVHRAFQLRRTLKPFWAHLKQHDQCVPAFMKTSVSTSVPRCGGDVNPFPVARLGSAFPDALIDRMAPISHTLEKIVKNKQGFLHQSKPGPQTIGGFSLSLLGASHQEDTQLERCMNVIEEFTLSSRRLLLDVRSRELEVVCSVKPQPRQCIVDALEPIALLFMEIKHVKAKLSEGRAGPMSPTGRAKQFKRRGQKVPELLEFEKEDELRREQEEEADWDLWHMEWDQTKLLLATPHYLLLDMQQRPKLDLLLQPHTRERIVNIASLHRKNHSLTADQVFQVSPAVSILYRWFWDLVAVTNKINECGASKVVLDASAAEHVARKKRQLAWNAATAVYQSEVENLFTSDAAPLDVFRMTTTTEGISRCEIWAQEWDSWVNLIRVIPSPPFHTQRAIVKPKKATKYSHVQSSLASSFTPASSQQANARSKVDVLPPLRASKRKPSVAARRK